MSETIVLDPAAPATSTRTSLDITNYIATEGPDWGDAAIEQYLAEGSVGENPVDFRLPNRQAVIPLKLTAHGATSFETIRRQIQAKVGLFHREGGWLQRTTTAGTQYADVTGATLHLGGDWLQAYKSADINAVLTVDMLPDWYGAEITLDDATEPTLPAFTKLLKLSAADAVISGDYPGRVRIVVDEDQAVSQVGLLWAWRARYYDSATTAALFYQAEALTPLDAAAIAGRQGASGGTTAASTATTTSGSANLTLVSPTTGWTNGMHVTGVGIPDNTTILSGAGTATMVMSATATANGSGVSISGAGVNVVLHSNLTNVWTPVLSTQILSGSAHMTHRGSLRVWARCYSLSAIPPQVRFLYDVGDLTLPTENDPKTIPGRFPFYLIDLGEIRLDPAPVGTHRWQGVIQAKGAAGGESIGIDSIAFQPIDDGAGRLIVPSFPTDPGLATFTARDEFNQSVGALTGKTAAVGGVWSGSGDADDFAVETTGHTAQRTAVSDSTPPRFVTVATNRAGVVVQADVKVLTNPANTPELGVLGRYVDTNNYLTAFMGASASGGGFFQMQAFVNVGLGASTATAFTDLLPGGIYAVDTFYTIRMHVDTSGTARAWLWPTGGVMPVDPALTLRSSLLATGGALATGLVGLRDHYTDASAITRGYDNFLSWPSTSDAVMFASQSAQLTTDGMVREDSAGVAYGPVSSGAIGSLPRIPPSGLENRKVELFLWGSRGDFDQIPDGGIDDISAQVFYRPCWLLTPGA